jgi:hypothetical protein
MRQKLAASTCTAVLLGVLSLTGSAQAASTLTPVAEGTTSWSQVEVHGGGWVTGIVTTRSGAVYARTDVGGAYRWEEAAQRWAQMITTTGVAYPAETDYSVESLAVAPTDGQTVYAAVDGHADTGRVLRSSDGGRTWRSPGTQRFRISGNGEWRQGGERLSVDPANPDVVMFGSRTQGVWRSEDGGVTWLRTTAPAGPGVGEPAGAMFTLFDPASPVVGGRTQGAWIGVQNVGVLRTDDAGRTWRVVHAVANGVPRDVDLASNGQLFFVVDGAPSQVVRLDTRTNAATVLRQSTADQFGSVAVDPTNPSLIFVGDDGVRDGKLWRSTNGGSAWTALNVALDADADDQWVKVSDIEGWMSNGAMEFDPARPGRLWFAEGMGVWTSSDLSDGEVTWRFTSDGIEELVSNAAVKPPGKPLVTASWDRGLFRHPTPSKGGAQLPHTTGFGSAWDVTASPTDPDFLAAVLNDHQDLSGGWHPNRKASAYSTDGGATWTRFPALAAGTAPADMMFGNIAVSAGNNDNLVWTPSRVWTRAYYTKDRGATWQRSNMPGVVEGDFLHPAHYLKRETLTADPVVPGTFYALGGNDRTGDPAVWKTMDGGANWTKLPATGLRPSYWDFRFNSHLVAVPGRSGHLFALAGHTDSGGHPFWRSTDGGMTWQEKTSVLNAHALGVGAPLTPGGPPTLYTYGRVGTKSGIYQSTDYGDRWTFISGQPNDWHQRVTAVVGDPEVPGKLYVGFSGGGFVVGESKTTSTPSTPPVSSPSLTTPPASSTPAVTRFLSDLPTVGSPVNGYGPVERDRSNGEDAAGDGRVLTLGGVQFAKGLGVHAASDIRFAVPAGCTTFTSTVGLDDEVTGGSVDFRVLVNGVQAFASDVRFATSPILPVSVPVRGGDELRLQVNDGGDGLWEDHGDWADAKLGCDASTAPAPTAPAPSPVTTAPAPAPSPVTTAPAPAPSPVTTAPTTPAPAPTAPAPSCSTKGKKETRCTTATRFTLSTTTVQTVAGQPAKLSTTVRPAKAGLLVALERKVGRSWVPVATTRTTASGAASFAYRPDSRTTTTLRFVTRSGQGPASASKVFALRRA